ncbi:MAG TPA: hypothetical protein VKT80_05685, partial [Chloroflexota bacterium]|nr:hypothetical protein [Chloroflexota bacterium]
MPSVLKKRYPRALVLIAVISLIATFTKPQTVARAASSGRFGVVEGYKAPAALNQSGASWDRINFFWNSYQPTGPTEWLGNANSTDADVARDLAGGVDVVGVITNPPA